MTEISDKAEKFVKRNKLFLIFLAVFAVTQLAIVKATWNSPLIWDSSVYVGMGKRMFSGWQFGIWELFRPLTLPVILGSLWKLGMPLIGFPRLVALVISVAGVAGIYIMIKDVFEKRIAFYSTAILMSTFIFYKYSHYALTGIPSAILVFTGAYFAQKDKTVSSGFLTSLGFLTRFPAATAAPGMAIYMFLRSVKEGISLRSIKKPLIYTVSFFATTVPYFAYNYYLYGDILAPLIQGSAIPASNPDKYFYGVFYLLEALKAQPFLIFLPLGIYAMFKARDWDYGAFFAPMVTLYLFFSVYSHKEPRFMLLFLPFMALFAGLGLKKIQEREIISEKAFYTVVTVILAVSMLLSFSVVYGQSQWVNTNRVEFMQETAKLNGTVAGNDPVVVTYGDFRFVPIRPENLDKIYGNIKGEADYYAINSCAWYCYPAIENCEQKLANFTSMMDQEYDKKFYNEGNSCNYTIYEGRN